ncbi:MAG: cytochrome P450 [Sandaracinaceae bacterium]|nr:cytochrome P450 [Sandaracinaceae bacterium]
MRDKGPHHAELFDVRHEHLRKLGMLDFVGPFDAGLMWAAQANTVSAAFWSCQQSSDRRARAEILEEVRGVSGGGDLLSPSGAAFSRHDLKNMVKLESAVTEMNRLTTAPMVPRRALKDTTLELRSGTYASTRATTWRSSRPPRTSIRRSTRTRTTFASTASCPTAAAPPARFWKDGQRVHFNLLPFGAGVSMCPGRFFAINELKIAVAVRLVLRHRAAHHRGAQAGCVADRLRHAASRGRRAFPLPPPRLRRSWRWLGKAGHAGGMALLAQISDAHLIELDPWARDVLDWVRLAFLSSYRPRAQSRVRNRACAFRRARDAGADHVVFTGDMTEDADPAQFALFAQVVGESGFAPAQVTLIPGNHDAYRGVVPHAAAVRARSPPWPGPAGASFDLTVSRWCRSTPR